MSGALGGSAARGLRGKPSSHQEFVYTCKPASVTECNMKPQLVGTQKRLSVATCAGAGVALSLRKQLTAVINGAFEVAVEIAVREVTELIGQVTGDIYEEMRRENECLKQRLHRAGQEGCASPVTTSQLQAAGDRAHQDPHLGYDHVSTQGGGVYVCTEDRDDVAGHSRLDEPPPALNHVTRDDQQRGVGRRRAKLTSDAASETQHSDGGAGAAVLTLLQLISPGSTGRTNQMCSYMVVVAHTYKMTRINRRNHLV